MLPPIRTAQRCLPLPDTRATQTWSAGAKAAPEGGAGVPGRQRTPLRACPLSSTDIWLLNAVATSTAGAGAVALPSTR